MGHLHSGIDIPWAVWVWNPGEKLWLVLQVTSKEKAWIAQCFPGRVGRDEDQ